VLAPGGKLSKGKSMALFDWLTGAQEYLETGTELTGAAIELVETVRPGTRTKPASAAASTPGGAIESGAKPPPWGLIVGGVVAVVLVLFLVLRK